MPLGLVKGLREFSYSDLLSATSSLKHMLGKGGFGKVYKGEYHGTELAVKVLQKEVTTFMMIESQ